MKRPYGIFAQDGNEVKFLGPASVRISRANRAALKAAQSYPGVFFAYYDDAGKPVGERHKPSRPDLERLGLIRPTNAMAELIALETVQTQQRRNRSQLTETVR
jgi:hypothetical protein